MFVFVQNRNKKFQYDTSLKNTLNIAYQSRREIGSGPPEMASPEDYYQAAPDNKIWADLKSGDNGALGYVYNTYIQDLFRFGYQFSKDKELIQDSIQDVFIAIGRKSDTSGKISSIKSYLFKALYREIMSKVSKNRKYHLTESFDRPEAFQIDVSVESLMVNRETFIEKIEQVKQALNNLSEKQRQAVLHYFYDGLTYDEIGEVMGIQHKNSVAKLIKRAIEMLKKNVIISLLIVHWALIWKTEKIY